MLSQKDIATSFAENLLKQIGSDDIEIKEENDSTKTNSSNGAVADSTTGHMKSPPIKCEATSTSIVTASSIRTKREIKTEPVLKIEKIYENDEKPIFCHEMDAKQISEACK